MVSRCDALRGEAELAAMLVVYPSLVSGQVFVAVNSKCQKTHKKTQPKNRIIRNSLCNFITQL